MGADTNHSRFIAELEARLEKLGAELGIAMYQHYLGDGSPDLNEIEARISEIYLDMANFERLSEAASGRLDPGTRLAVTYLRRWFTANQVNRHPDVYRLRNEIEEELLSFKPVVAGSRVSRARAREMLRKEGDRQLRKEAYYAELPLAARVRERVLKLVRLRRDLAREIGAENYPDLILTLQDNDIGDLRLLFDLLEEQTSVRFDNYLQHLTAESSIDQIAPWDIAYLFEQKRLPDKGFPKEGIMPAVKEIFGGMGFGIDELGIDVKFHDIPFGGLCFGIRVPDDVRILANPRNGHSYYATLFHEFGHAVYDKLVDQEHYAARHDTSSCFTEGVAVFFSRFADDREWLMKRKGLSAKQVDNYLNRRAYTLMLRIRSLMSRALLEYHIYEDPDQDIDGLWAQLVHKFVRAKSEPGGIWAASPFHVSHPVYLQNYVLAEMIAQQLYDYLSHHYATLLGNRVVSKFMIKNFFGPGGTVAWRDKVEFATERALGPEALLAAMGVK
jgi:peptidyl-dipeptidase A